MQSLIVKNVMCLSVFLILTACNSTVVLHPPEYKVPVLQTDDHYKYAVLNWKKNLKLRRQCQHLVGNLSRSYSQSIDATIESRKFESETS